MKHFVRYKPTAPYVDALKSFNLELLNDATAVSPHSSESADITAQLIREIPSWAQLRGDLTGLTAGEQERQRFEALCVLYETRRTVVRAASHSLGRTMSSPSLVVPPPVLSEREAGEILWVAPDYVKERPSGESLLAYNDSGAIPLFYSGVALNRIGNASWLMLVDEAANTAVAKHVRDIWRVLWDPWFKSYGGTTTPSGSFTISADGLQRDMLERMFHYESLRRLVEPNTDSYSPDWRIPPRSLPGIELGAIYDSVERQLGAAADKVSEAIQEAVGGAAVPLAAATAIILVVIGGIFLYKRS